MSGPLNELKKLLYTAVLLTFVLPLAIQAITCFLVKIAPFVLLGLVIMGAIWLGHRVWRRWRDY